LLDVAEAKGDPALKAVIDGMDLKIAGKMLAGDQGKLNHILQKVTELGNDSKFKDFIENIPNDKLMAAWPSLRDSKITLNPAEREALFKKMRRWRPFRMCPRTAQGPSMARVPPALC